MDARRRADGGVAGGSRAHRRAPGGADAQPRRPGALRRPRRRLRPADARRRPALAGLRHGGLARHARGGGRRELAEDRRDRRRHRARLGGAGRPGFPVCERS